MSESASAASVNANETASAEVPHVETLAIGDARSRLEPAGLQLSIVGGDPTGDDAVIVAQEPPAGTSSPIGSVVGARTPAINSQLCEALNALPEREGDAVDLARSTGFTQALRAAAPRAVQPLIDAIDVALANLESGGDLDLAPADVVQSLDRSAIHRDGCATL